MWKNRTTPKLTSATVGTVRSHTYSQCRSVDNTELTVFLQLLFYNTPYAQHFTVHQNLLSGYG